MKGQKGTTQEPRVPELSKGVRRFTGERYFQSVGFRNWGLLCGMWGGRGVMAEVQHIGPGLLGFRF